MGWYLLYTITWLVWCKFIATCWYTTKHHKYDCDTQVGFEILFTVLVVATIFVPGLLIVNHVACAIHNNLSLPAAVLYIIIFYYMFIAVKG